jgi:hypothetical protein
MIRRVTAREFQKRFQRMEEPVLVNEGIWFPKASAELMAIAEGRAVPERHLDVEMISVAPDYRPAQPETVVRPISKTDQAKGRSRK